MIDNFCSKCERKDYSEDSCP